MCTSIHCPLHGQTCADCLNNEERPAGGSKTVKKPGSVKKPGKSRPFREVCN